MALFLGVPVAQVRLGPVTLARAAGHWRLSRTDLVDLRRTWIVGGVAPAFEGRGPAGLRGRCLAVVAAGPVAQVMVGLGAAGLALAGGGVPLRVAAVPVIALGLAELLPIQVDLDGVTQGDGFTLRQWLVDPAAARQRTAAGALAAALRQPGRQPRDWDPRRVALADCGETATSAALVQGGRLVSYHLVDGGEVGRARRPLLAAHAGRALVPDRIRRSLIAWAAFWVARFGSDAERAGRMLADEPDWPTAEYEHGLATAAIALAAGRPAEALTWCDWLLLRDGPATSYTAMLQEQVEALRTDAAAAGGDAPVPEGGVPSKKAAAVAHRLNVRAWERWKEGRHEEQLALCNEVVRRFAGAAAPEIRKQVAIAMTNRGPALRRLDRLEEAIAANAEVAGRFDAGEGPDVRESLAIALDNLARFQAEAGRREDALVTLNELLRRLGDAPELAVLDRVAGAVRARAEHLAALGRREEAAGAFQVAAHHLAAAADPEQRRWVPRALFRQAALLRELGRLEGAISACDEVLRWLGDAPTPDQWASVAAAIFNRALYLHQLQRHEEAMAACQELVRRFGDAEDQALRVDVADALSLLARSSADAGRPEAALAAQEKLERRFGQDPDPALRDALARGLLARAAALRALGRPWDAVATDEEVKRRYRGSADPTLRSLVEWAARALPGRRSRATAPGRPGRSITASARAWRRPRTRCG